MKRSKAIIILTLLVITAMPVYLLFSLYNGYQTPDYPYYNVENQYISYHGEKYTKKDGDLYVDDWKLKLQPSDKPVMVSLQYPKIDGLKTKAYLYENDPDHNWLEWNEDVYKKTSYKTPGYKSIPYEDVEKITFLGGPDLEREYIVRDESIIKELLLAMKQSLRGEISEESWVDSDGDKGSYWVEIDFKTFEADLVDAWLLEYDNNGRLGISAYPDKRNIDSKIYLLPKKLNEALAEKL